jgi:RluA family pseudouridine synthase
VDLDIVQSAQLADLSRRYPTQELVPAEQAGQPVAAIIGPLFAIGPQLTALLLARGSVWMDGKRVIDPGQIAPAGGRIVIHTPPDGVYVSPAVSADMLLYEDETLLVLNKPPGWFSVPNPWDALGNLEMAIERFVLARDGEHPPLHLVHRLDRDTSGVLVVSKDPAINSKFQELFNTNRVHKTYLAWCAGAPEWDSLEVVTGHSRGGNGVWTLYPAEMIGAKYGPNGRVVRRAHTTLRVIRRGVGATLLEAELHTGRTHQIRLHAQHVGHPVLGDGRYGEVMELNGLALGHHLLHAAHITLPHPCRSATLDISAPPPPLWHEVERVIGS